MKTLKELEKELKKERRKNKLLTQALEQNKSIHDKYNNSVERLRLKDEALKNLNHHLEVKIEEQTKALKEALERYAFAIKGSNDGLWDWNIKTKKVFFSSRWKEIIGFQEDELEDKFEIWENRIHPDDKTLCMSHVNKSLDGEIDHFENEHRLLHKDGSWVWVRNKGRTFFDKNGNPIRMSGFHTNITSSKEKEQIIKEKEALVFAQSKMSIMGEMLENLGHQWRQPLSMISSTSTGLILQKEIDNLSDKELYSALNLINNTTQGLSKTIDEFRDFFIANQSNVIFDMKHAFNKTKRVLHFDFDRIIILQKIENIKIKGSELEMVQVLMNLFTNARNEFHIKDIFVKVIEVEVYEKDKKAYIIISDNAGGIPPEIKEKIFDPYFTTKGDFGGTGVGLHMCKMIIEEHFNGEIKVSNEPFIYDNREYSGAKFSIEIPLYS